LIKADFHLSIYIKGKVERTMNEELLYQGQSFKPHWLVGVNLHNTNLIHIDLEGGALTWSELTGSTLDYANLKRCDLSKSNLECVHMHDALLQSANLESVNGYQSEFRNTNLVNANFRDSNFNGALFYKCNMHNANLLGAGFHKAKLIGCDLTGAILLNADLREADLSRSDMTGALLTGAMLDGAILDETIMIDTIFSEGQLVEASSSKRIVVHEISKDKIQMMWGNRYTVQLFVEEDLLNKYENEAKCLGISFNDLSVLALKEYFIKMDNKQDIPA
jgi:uncharacterized protein YjbI with pentapeptide repeats